MFLFVLYKHIERTKLINTSLIQKIHALKNVRGVNYLGALA